jgi:hypothetical protein
VSASATQILSEHIAKLLGVPYHRMRKMVVTIEARQAPKIEVEYFIVGERAEALDSVIASDGERVRTEMKRFHVVDAGSPNATGP